MDILKSKNFSDEELKSIPLDKVLFCNISWMKNYAGTIVGDRPYSGAEFVKNTGDAFEKYNFADFGDEFQYGFIETKYVHGVISGQDDHYKKINIEHFGCSNNEDRADNILIVFFARNPKDNKYYIVGYYKNASVFRNRHNAPILNPNEQFQYNLRCFKQDAYLVKVAERVPLNCSTQLFHRALFFYPSEEKENKEIYKKIVDAVMRFDKTKDSFDLSIAHNSWAIPCNPAYYDIDRALKELSGIWYRQTLRDVSAGDFVYIYVSRPYQSYKYKCVVLDSNVLSSDIELAEDKEYNLAPATLVAADKYMRLKLLNEGNVPISEVIKNVEGVGVAPQSQISLKNKYLEFLSKQFDKNDVSFPSLADLDDNVNETIDVEISNVPAEEKIRNNIAYLPRNERTKRIALNNARNKCANTSCTHELFVKRNGEFYLEVHHLIPISAYKDFPNVNIDIPENTVCLCPSCHREIHFGENARELIVSLYNSRKASLEAKGILLANGIGQLLKYYNLEE